MVILRVKLDNVLSFKKFDVCFSYPSKLKTSLIENEHLEYVPSFRYKKLNVLIGANASGKTSLIKCIWKTLAFLRFKEKQQLFELINQGENNSKIELDVALDGENIHELHRFKILTDNLDSDLNVKIAHNVVLLSAAKTSKDSYESKLKLLDEMPDEYQDYIEALKDVNYITGWNAILPATEPNFDKVRFAKINNDKELNDYLDILTNIFKTMDPSINKILKSKDVKNAFVIDHECNKIVVQEGMPLSAIPYLSSGTKYSINIANMIFFIKYHQNGLYLIDEQFSYVNSDVEAAILSTMISLLGPNEQLFFTTHNNEILNLGFPFHSFYFMKKEKTNNGQMISISCGSEAENRNNVSPKTLVDNDVFGTAPKVDKIFEISENNN